MRILTGVLALLMALFAAVQYNDPDGPFWVAVYGVVALWCAIATVKPGLFSRATIRILFACYGAAAVAGLVFYWPKTADWWRIDVWWHTETAREGMGMMIIIACLIAVAIVARRDGRAAS
ncbi:MAG: transmembrane 220 family protein [Pseudomonadota bacterium]